MLNHMIEPAITLRLFYGIGIASRGNDAEGCGISAWSAKGAGAFGCEAAARSAGRDFCANGLERLAKMDEGMGVPGEELKGKALSRAGPNAWELLEVGDEREQILGNF